MSHSVVKITVIVTACIWAALLLSITAVSWLNVDVGGIAPEAFRLTLMMTLPFTVGLSIIAVGTAFIVQMLQAKRQHKGNAIS